MLYTCYFSCGISSLNSNNRSTALKKVKLRSGWGGDMWLSRNIKILIYFLRREKFLKSVRLFAKYVKYILLYTKSPIWPKITLIEILVYKHLYLIHLVKSLTGYSYSTILSFDRNNVTTYIADFRNFSLCKTYIY